jgi:hypothetical protein
MNFGPHDPTGEAEAELEHRQMKENHQITCYNVNFACLAAQCKWGKAALHYQYYRRLLDRIKDEIAHVGKPTLLSGLRKLAQDIDGCYHEQRSEISHENLKPPKSGSTKSAPKQQSKPTTSTSAQTPQKSSDKKPEGSECAAPPKTNAARLTAPSSRNPELHGKLGKDGNPTPEECQWRFDNKLCMFCGGTGHIAANCNKKNAKARSASVAESSDSKK